MYWISKLIHWFCIFHAFQFTLKMKFMWNPFFDIKFTIITKDSVLSKSEYYFPIMFSLANWLFIPGKVLAIVWQKKSHWYCYRIVNILSIKIEIEKRLRPEMCCNAAGSINFVKHILGTQHCCFESIAKQKDDVYKRDY